MTVSQIRPTSSNPVRRAAQSRSFRVLMLLLLHIPLAIVMHSSPLAARLHAVVTLAVGAFWLLTKRDATYWVYWASYVTGAEVLWRMTGGAVSHESAKYAVAIVFILGTLKQRSLPRADKWPLVYFALLLPSCLLMPQFDRELIAFNLAGPFSLAAASLYLSTVHLSTEQLGLVCIAALGPIMSTAYLATHSMLTAESLVFGGGSNRIAAGDSGPNQVSAILGLGALLAFLFVVIERGHRRLRIIVAGILLWMIAQAMLTFSRGGVWTALGAVLVAGFYLVRERRLRRLTLVDGIVAGLLVWYLLLPALDAFTGEMLSARFGSADPTGRDLIVEADLIAFRENPLFGVGPGQSRAYHALLYMPSLPHTEFSRLLAEHGSLGLLSLLILLGVTLRRASARVAPLSKAYSVSLTAWALLDMTHVAMRLVAAPFAFGLASAISPQLSPAHGAMRED